MGTDTTIYIARATFTTMLDGREVTIRAGIDRVRAGHPLLKGRESMFEPLTVQYDIEQASAAPGERRGDRQ